MQLFCLNKLTTDHDFGYFNFIIFIDFIIFIVILSRNIYEFVRIFIF